MQRNKWILYFGLATLVVAAAACRGSNSGAGSEGSGAEAVAPEGDGGEVTAWWDPGGEWGLADEPTKGAADALVTIVEFSDFQCGYCNRVRGTLDEILADEDFGDKVRIIMLQHPLDFHPQANLASQAALAAHDQGKYWEYHDVLFDNMRALERENLEAYAEEVGLDMVAFRAALDDETHAARIDEQLELAGELGIRGTPNFMINGRNLTGARPFDSFAEVIREEVEAMEAMIEEGKTPAEAYAARLEENLEEADEPAAPADAPPARPTPDPAAELYVPVGDSPFKGPEDALITIVEFSDFQCPFCSRVNPTIEQIFAEFGDDVRVVFKHNALSFHDRAEPAARASIAAQRQGKFWEYHDILFENQRALTDENLTSYAEQLGLDMDQWREDFASESAAAHVAEDMELARRLAASGTPHFFVNGFRLRGAQPFARFQTLITEQLEVANGLIEAGTPRAGIYAALQEDAVRGNAPMIQPPAAAAPARPAAVENNDPVEIDVSGAPFKGPEDAPVTIVEFTDFECPYCSRFANALDEAVEPYGDQVRVVVMSFPLSFHQRAHLAAQASLAAHAQGKYWEYHDLLFANQRALERADLERYGEQIGLDMTAFNAALDNGTYRERVDEEMARGRAVGITGTPGWFVNGVKFGGARPVAAIRAEIDRALEALE